MIPLYTASTTAYFFYKMYQKKYKSGPNISKIDILKYIPSVYFDFYSTKNNTPNIILIGTSLIFTSLGIKMHNKNASISESMLYSVIFQRIIIEVEELIKLVPLSKKIIGISAILGIFVGKLTTESDSAVTKGSILGVLTAVAFRMDEEIPSISTETNIIASGVTCGSLAGFVIIAKKLEMSSIVLISAIISSISLEIGLINEIGIAGMSSEIAIMLKSKISESPDVGNQVLMLSLIPSVIAFSGVILAPDSITQVTLSTLTSSLMGVKTKLASVMALDGIATLIIMKISMIAEMSLFTTLTSVGIGSGIAVLEGESIALGLISGIIGIEGIKGNNNEPSQDCVVYHNDTFEHNDLISWIYESYYHALDYMVT